MILYVITSIFLATVITVYIDIVITVYTCDVMIDVYVRALLSGYTPLHYAAFYGYSEVVNALVATGATVDIMDNVSYNNNIV